MDNPLVSIIIPAYNLEKYIERAITSVINQNFFGIELIIIDDCSTDNTLNIINKYANINKNIIVIKHSKNESQHIARINGVEAAKGKYILFLDGDDYFSNKSFKKLFDIIHKNHGYDFYEFGYIERPSGKRSFYFSYDKDRFSAFFNTNVLPNVWNKVYEANLLKKAFSVMEKAYINNAQDIYESIVISYFAKKIFFIKKAFINYSIGNGTSTTYKNYEKTIEYLTMLKTIFSLINNFLIKYNLKTDIENLIIRELKKTFIKYFYTQKDEQTMIRLFNELPNYFNIDILIKYIYQNEYKNRSNEYYKKKKRNYLIYYLKRVIKFFMPYGILKLINSKCYLIR